MANKKQIISDLESGNTQAQVAEEHGYSQAYISKIWTNHVSYLEGLKEEVESRKASRKVAESHRAIIRLLKTGESDQEFGLVLRMIGEIADDVEDPKGLLMDIVEAAETNETMKNNQRWWTE